MIQLIKQVLEDVPQGMAFDTHLVIQKVVETDSDAYIRFTSQYADSEVPTLTSHQQFGLLLEDLCGSVVERLPHQSYSFNIHHNVSECALWRKL